MKRPAAKSLGILIAGVALGWSFRGLPQWSGGPEVIEDLPAAAGVQSGAGAAYDGNPSGSTTKAGFGKTSEKSSRQRVEMLAATFRGKKASEGRTAEISLIVEIAELSAEETRAVTELLAEEKMDNATAQLLLTRWAMLDPKAALAFALDHPKFSGSAGLMEIIVGEVAKTDLSAAKAALARLGYEERNHVGRALVRGLMRGSMPAALACARELEFNDAEVEVLNEWAESDLHAAAEELTLGQVRDLNVVEEMAPRMMNEDRGAFEAWVERLADPAQKAVARRVSLEADAAANPKSAALATAAWLASEPAASEHAGDLPKQIVQSLIWAEGRHAEVAAWAAGLPPGLARDTAIIEAGRLYIEQDTMRASAWLGTLPEGFGRDGAVLYLAEKITGETPADAFEWVRTVKTPELRKAGLRRLAENWTRQYPEAARQALETLSADDRLDLRDTLEAAQKEGGKAQKQE